MKYKVLKYGLPLILVFFSIFLIFRLDFLQYLELFFYNLRVEFQTQSKPIDDIILITVDTETQKKYNFGVIPYSEYGKLVTTLSQARVIGIDNALVDFTNLKDIRSFSKILANRNNIVLSSQLIGLSRGSDSVITYVPPIPNFSKYCKYGYHNYVTDIDGYVRRTAFNYTFKTQGRLEKSFSTVVAEKVIGSLDINQNSYFINYFGKSNFFKKYSFKDVVENPYIIKEDLKNKIVLVGSDFDTYYAPFIFNKKITRVELHANNILTILRKSYINKVNVWINLVILILMLISGILISLSFGTRKGTIIIISIAFSYLLLNFIAFAGKSIYLNLTTPLLGVTLSFASIKYFIYYYQSKEILKIKNIFKPYLSPNMLDEVITEKDYIKALKGERRIVTIMFADIADFTSLSERLPTEHVVMILNEFLTCMTNIIFKNKGTLDKYTGDGVMAVFGNIGKINIKDSTYRAAKTAVEMKYELEKLQKSWIQKGLIPLQIRIGLNTGEVIVGNIGSPQQMDVTVIGDAVNTAARIEKLNKQLNTTILITKNTYEYVKENVNAKSYGEFSLKGKNKKVEVFELIDVKD